MADDPKDKPPEDPDQTLIQPAAPAIPDDEATLYQPAEPTRVVAAPAPAAKQGQIQVGSQLNGIYEVKRFIARGGMGEVYEGVNVNTEERVAIKVILQHLAADPNVRQMFLREAQTLTKLGHPALVAYRLAAQEPTLGVFYIVTEFVDGKNLADVLGTAKPNEAELAALTKRLAEGLRAAHEFKVYHRDMSPDNVLLVGGRLAEAKIIDFGIAKDAGASSATIIGDGFAGKLNYVAPEQFGDFGREIGPWTDVYSLALVIIAVANGKAMPMGATLIDAIEKRRAGVDLSVLPDGLKPIFAKMLAPDPKDRYRDMDQVVDALAHLGPPGRRGSGSDVAMDPTVVIPAGQTPARPAAAKSGGGNRNLLIGGAAAVVVLGAGGFFAMQAMKPKAGADGTAAASTAAAVVEKVLPTLACSWIEISDVSQADGKVSLKLTGAARDPNAAVGSIVSALQQAGVSAVNTDTNNVSQLAPEACSAIDSFRKFRASASVGRWVTPQASEFHFKASPACGNHPKMAPAVIEVDKPPGGSDDVALVGMEANGKVQVLFGSLDEFHKLQSSAPTMLVEQAQKLQLNLCNDRPVATGVLVIRGASPFDLGLPNITQDGAIAPADFAQKFESMAKSKGWRTQMAWYRVVGN